MYHNLNVAYFKANRLTTARSRNQIVTSLLDSRCIVCKHLILLMEYKVNIYLNIHNTGVIDNAERIGTFINAYARLMISFKFNFVRLRENHLRKYFSRSHENTKLSYV